MPKAVILFLLIFSIFQFACAEAPILPVAQVENYLEKEKVDPYLWDFGQVKQGTISKHDFILKNETNSILGINNIHTSCGCTVSESDKKSLMPQESTTITVSFNSQGYLGPVTQFVYVDTDNKDLAIIKFTVNAKVVKD
jgi:hypothetical protein